MLTPPIRDLRDRSKHAIPFLMNNHGITIESISMERIRYNRNIERIFIFRSRFNFSPEIDASFDASYSDFPDYSEEFKNMNDDKGHF